MKRLVAYLKGTRDGGMHVRKITKNVLECHSETLLDCEKEYPQDLLAMDQELDLSSWCVGKAAPRYRQQTQQCAQGA